jgi:signal transduction histidine kinase
MENILTKATNSELFYYYIYDQDDYMIYSNNSKYQAWEKYLLEDKIPFNKQNLLKSDVLLDKNSGETLYIALEEKEKKDVLQHLNKTFIILTFFILPISFILGYLLSRIPKTLFDNLEEQQKVLIKQSKLLAMGEIVESLAHQWRQPLNTIGVLTQEIKFNHTMDTLDKKTMETLNSNIQAYLDELSKTIDNFRSFFKPQHEKNIFDMLQCIHNTVNVIKPKLDEHDIILTIEDYNTTNNIDPYSIIGYENEMKQSLLNLLTNATESIIRSEKELKKIYITLQRDQSELSISIKDTGEGIESKYLNKIFEPYFSTKENELQGSGLGLYIVKTTIERTMHGTVEVFSKNQKTIFKLTIPIES